MLSYLFFPSAGTSISETSQWGRCQLKLLQKARFNPCQCSWGRGAVGAGGGTRQGWCWSLFLQVQENCLVWCELWDLDQGGEGLSAQFDIDIGLILSLGIIYCPCVVLHLWRMLGWHSASVKWKKQWCKWWQGSVLEEISCVRAESWRLFQAELSLLIMYKTCSYFKRGMAACRPELQGLAFPAKTSPSWFQTPFREVEGHPSPEQLGCLCLLLVAFAFKISFYFGGILLPFQNYWSGGIFVFCFETHLQVSAVSWDLFFHCVWSERVTKTSLPSVFQCEMCSVEHRETNGKKCSNSIPEAFYCLPSSSAKQLSFLLKFSLLFPLVCGDSYTKNTLWHNLSGTHNWEEIKLNCNLCLIIMEYKILN